LSLYWITVTVHVLAALFWLGGMFFLALVGAPVLRRVEPAPLRASLFRQLGEGFRTAGWIAIGLLLATGLLNLQLRGMLSWDVLGSTAFWGSRFGTSLAWKLVLVTLMVGVSAFHDFVQGPAAGKLQPGSPEAVRARHRAAWLGRINAALGLLLVYVAVRLARGG
jgi:copper resistance protein D